MSLGPTFVKFGQVLSTRPDIVPKDILDELVKLQDMVSPLPFAVVETVIVEELGLSVERAFESFETEPMASASIGQVHGAVLARGAAGGGQGAATRGGQEPSAETSSSCCSSRRSWSTGWIWGSRPSGVVQEFARSVEPGARLRP